MNQQAILIDQARLIEWLRESQAAVGKDVAPGDWLRMPRVLRDDAGSFSLMRRPLWH